MWVVHTNARIGVFTCNGIQFIEVEHRERHVVRVIRKVDEESNSTTHNTEIVVRVGRHDRVVVKIEWENRPKRRALLLLLLLLLLAPLPLPLPLPFHCCGYYCCCCECACAYLCVCVRSAYVRLQKKKSTFLKPKATFVSHIWTIVWLWSSPLSTPQPSTTITIRPNSLNRFGYLFISYNTIKPNRSQLYSNIDRSLFLSRHVDLVNSNHKSHTSTNNK